MKTIEVDKNELLVKLAENRDKHIERYHDAYRGFIEAAQRRLDEQLKRIANGKHPNLHAVLLEPPQNHTDDYDRVIQMLEMDMASTVELTESEFRTYVQDDWQWKQAWLMNTSQYSDG